MAGFIISAARSLDYCRLPEVGLFIFIIINFFFLVNFLVNFFFWNLFDLPLIFVSILSVLLLYLFLFFFGGLL